MSQAFRPDYAVAPGESVLETIVALGLTQSELADRTGRPKKTINEIIRGKTAITPETALQFERVLGVPAAFWTQLEQNYRAALARGAENDRLKEQVGWLDTMPVKAMRDMGWVDTHRDRVEQLREVLSFYGVASVEAWHSIWADLRSAASYRKADAFEADFTSVTAWLRRGEIEAREILTDPFDAQAFREVLLEARALTLDDTASFVPELVGRCAEVGVAVCFVPPLPKARVYGATRWLSPEKALVQLSLRYKTNDHLWFTFFHEAGHILLHGKRSVFLEQKGGAAKGIAGSREPEEGQLEREEEEANEFAQDLMIPSAEFGQFVSESTFTGSAIKAFAERVGIHPGIVLGRLQREGLVPYPTKLNRNFKVSFRFVDGG